MTTLHPGAPTAAAALFAVLLTGGVSAHPGVDRQIDDVTLQIEQQPEDAQLWLRRGELRRIHRDWKPAESDFRRARKLDPELAAVDFLLGRLMLDAGRPKKAKSYLDKYLKARPDHAEARVVRARALAQLGRSLAAAGDFDRALALLEENGRPIPTYYIERARVLAAAGPEHMNAALAGLEEGLARLGQPVTLQLYAIELELDLHRYDAALARLDRIAAQANRQETWLVRRGAILEQASRVGEARVAYAAALDAIEALPAARSGNRAVRSLQVEAEAALERLRATP